jgi:hypothetical protein
MVVPGVEGALILAARGEVIFSQGAPILAFHCLVVIEVAVRDGR